MVAVNKTMWLAILLIILTALICGDGGDNSGAHISDNCDNCQLDNLEQINYPTVELETE